MIRFIFFLLLSFSFVVEAQETEASSPVCMEIECLIKRHPNSSLGKIENMCKEALPDYCDDIKKEYTRCYVQGGALDITGDSVASCGMGVADVVKGVLEGFIFLGKGAVKLTLDSEYRSEAVNTASVFLNDVVQGDGLQELKEMISSAVVEYFDEIAHCLNATGRVHYFCEVATEVGGLFLGGVGFAKGGKAIKEGGAGKVGKAIKEDVSDVKTKFSSEIQDLVKNINAKNINELTASDKIILRIDLEQRVKSGFRMEGLHLYQWRRIVDDSTVFGLSNDNLKLYSSYITYNQHLHHASPMIIEDMAIGYYTRYIPTSEIQRLSVEKMTPVAFEGFAGSKKLSVQQVLEASPEQIQQAVYSLDKSMVQHLSVEKMTPEVFENFASLKKLSDQQVLEASPEQIQKAQRWLNDK